MWEIMRVDEHPCGRVSMWMDSCVELKRGCAVRDREK